MLAAPFEQRIVIGRWRVPVNILAYLLLGLGGFCVLGRVADGNSGDVTQYRVTTLGDRTKMRALLV